MTRYLVTRLLQALFVLWAAYTVTFVILFLLPSDPVEIRLAAGGDGGVSSQDELDALRAEYGLDQPLWVQYFSLLSRFVRGDLGNSIATGTPVSESLRQALPQTLALAGAALLLALLLGVGVAMLASRLRTRWLQQALLSLPSLGVAVPTFWSGLLLLQLFSFRLGWFPSLGNKGIESMVLPAIALALPNAAYVAQVLARSLRHAVRQPYVDTARARGASTSRVLFRHALPNAVIPALTMVGICAGNLLGGAVVVETVFSRVGIGKLTQTAVAAQDTPVVQTLVVLAAAIFVVVNLLVDLLYPLIDPRIAVRRSRRRPAVTTTPEKKETADV
ncbi:ABC transporter permease subunit [Nakamurella sp. YIM 132087]|uniref:ABC transporter permease subunit n=1 Tax=Nakamurella alba TaxID=2665158 RepID=A0A7K1FUX1_9ACTN|nr:ABC transporter permease [Nakamurella alba]MTD16624.1 ABC transporter permease subunit [Nakamurella alba]